MTTLAANPAADSIIILKCGGAILQHPQQLASLSKQIAHLTALGYHPVIVHGGGPQINDLAKRLGVHSQFINGLRVTTPELLEIIQMVLIGQINSQLCQSLSQAAVLPIGLSCHDAQLIAAQAIDLATLGYAGTVTRINTLLIREVLQLGYTPVIAPLGCGIAGDVYNVNADSAAAALATSLQARHLILLSDIDGYYAQATDPSTLVPQLTTQQISKLIAQGNVSGGMLPKLQAGLLAASDGVITDIINGNHTAAMVKLIVNQEQVGTRIVKGEE
jgi:acetylglutamate kinase